MTELDIKNVVKIVLITLDHCLDGCKDIQEVKKKIDENIIPHFFGYGQEFFTGSSGYDVLSKGE